MLKTVISLYFVGFSLYVLFSRQPDWFDSVMVPATIVQKDGRLVAEYSLQNKTAYAPAEYPLRSIQPGQKVEVIYELSQPKYATVYSVWGYWLKWTELLSSLLIIVVVYFAATEITARPSPESLIEQLEANSPKKRKYIDD